MIEQSTLAIVLIVSAALSGLYSVFLEHIHDLYMPNYTWLTVVCGNGFVIGTLAVLEQDFGIMLTSVLVLYVNVAWGAPIVIWQLWQWHERAKLKRHALHKLS